MNLYDPKMLFIYFFGRTDLKMKETNRAEENVWNSLEKFQKQKSSKNPQSLYRPEVLEQNEYLDYNPHNNVLQNTHLKIRKTDHTD